MPDHPSKSVCSKKTRQRIGLKPLSWLRVEVKAFGISWSELEKEWNLQEWSTKKLHSLRLFFFGIGVFKGCNTLLWKHTCYDLRVFQNMQDKPRNVSQVFTKASPQLPCLVFSLEKITDRQIDLLLWALRYPAQCTGLEPLPQPPLNKIRYRLHPKYTPFFCFPLICLSAIWK